MPTVPQKSTATLCNFIKSYLPVRLRLLQQSLDGGDDDDDENDDGDDENVDSDKKDESKRHYLTMKNNNTDHDSTPIDETFFYIKEHAVNSGSSRHTDNTTGSTAGNGTTIFVANCPMIPNISTKLLLQSIFGRYGDVARVTVIPKPTTTSNQNQSRMASYIETPYEHEPYRWTDQYAMKPSYCHQQNEQQVRNISNGTDSLNTYNEGKFAHVVFTSPKEMKRTFRIIHEIMSSSSTATGTTRSNKNNSSHDHHHNKAYIAPAVTLEPIEIQTLQDESDRQMRQPQSPNGQNNNFEDDDEEFDDQMTAVQMVAQKYRTNCQRYISTGGYGRNQQLLEECNRIMELYETKETAAEQLHHDITTKPDDDGFITVSYNSATSATVTNDFEHAQDINNNNKRSRSSAAGSGSKRLRNNNNKKKKGLGLGSLPIPDFYRFQTREHQQNSISELRQRFEQDKIRIQQMKDRNR